LLGDLNVAHNENDLAIPEKRKNKAPGFTDQERNSFTNFLSKGFVDIWRQRNPDVQAIYSYWSYKFQCKQKNLGWRIDYFIASQDFAKNVGDYFSRPEESASDHVPIGILMDKTHF